LTPLARLCLAGVAEAEPQQKKEFARKGGAFPHFAAAKPHVQVRGHFHHCKIISEKL
jgi:hypothetical protein